VPKKSRRLIRGAASGFGLVIDTPSLKRSSTRRTCVMGVCPQSLRRFLTREVASALGHGAAHCGVLELPTHTLILRLWSVRRREAVAGNSGNFGTSR
jgi:hypothetical protein